MLWKPGERGVRRITHAVKLAKAVQKATNVLEKRWCLGECSSLLSIDFQVVKKDHQ